MNYYEHHIGDYDKNTSHLTACEDGIYSRMIRRYYDKEAPLPADMEQLCRLVRARSREEKKAVAAVATEFFFQIGDELHHTKCDEVLEEYLAGEPEREAKKKNEDTRLAKHRAERALLFTIINGAGLHLAWNTPMADLRAAAARLQTQQGQGAATPPAMETATPPATAPATPATATQSPIPNTHTPVLKPEATTASENSTGVARCSPGEISKAMRAETVMSQPDDPRIMALAEQGVSIATVTAACKEAREAKPNERIGVGYVVAILSRWAKDAAGIRAKGARSPPSGPSNKQDSRAAAAASIGLGAPRHDDTTIIDINPGTER